MTAFRRNVVFLGLLAACIGESIAATRYLSAEGDGAAGVWCYKPYEYEAWMLQRMRAEADRGVLHFQYPGKFLVLTNEPTAVWCEAPREGLEPIPGAKGMPPHRLERPEKEMPVALRDGVYDLGHEDIGYVRAASVERPNLFVGESLSEVKNSDADGFEQSLLMVPEGPGRWRSDIPLALRYFRFSTAVESASFHSQLDWREPIGSFVCGDRRKERIWRTGVETLRCCTRTFLIDGIKRDRLPWAGDLAVEVLAQAYSFGDAEPVKRTLAALGSGDMAQGHVNGIAAYSLWWVIAHDLLQRYFGEPDYLRLHYPRIRERMAEVMTHEDGRGFFAKDLGWDFMDWVDSKGGSLQSEISRQVIYFGALKAAERLAVRVGDGESAKVWSEKAARLKSAILAEGMDGTRHSRMLAIVFDLVDEATSRSYAREIAADRLPPTVTPYMSTFEVMALMKAGETDAAMRKFESVWGVMADAGVSTYWEGWDPKDRGDEAYVFYGRPFAKSLCHAWSAGPAFLIPGVFLGIRPTSDGWATHEVRPAFRAFAPNARVVVPTRRGSLEIRMSPAGQKVRADLGALRNP